MTKKYRKLDVITHWLRSGNIPSNKYKHLIKLTQSSLYDVCRRVDDVYHVLMECVRYESVRQDLIGDLVYTDSILIYDECIWYIKYMVR